MVGEREQETHLYQSHCFSSFLNLLLLFILSGSQRAALCILFRVLVVVSVRNRQAVFPPF